ncbi:MAG: XRE family transcriptional regulator [Proteobacteria bacterium]|nr:XRE family transcriptional regulator [Pseudomonadota bacterium]
MFDTIKADDNIFLALGSPQQEADVLKMRSDLIIILVIYVKEQGWTQQEAAERLGIPQTLVSELVQGKWKTFSLDILIGLAARVGKRVRLELDEAA